MTFHVFTQKVQAALQKYYGDHTTLEIQKVTKNNGLELTGIVIREEASDVASTIYLEQFFDEYEEGVSMSDTVRRIIRIYETNKEKQNIDMSFFYDYTEIRKRLSCRLINRDLNEKLLEKVPHRLMENLAMVYQCLLIDDDFGCASLVIEYSHLKFWDVTEHQLFQDVLKNMPVILPAMQIPMQHFVQDNIRKMLEDRMELFQEQVKKEFDHEDWETVMDNLTEMFSEGCPEELEELRILTNCHKFYGAAVILYPGLLERLAEEFAESFFILPSSVHEVILLADTGDREIARLREMVCEVNRTNVSADEFLSDDIYYYRKGDGFIRKL